jgi:hypothetical protein
MPMCAWFSDLLPFLPFAARLTIVFRFPTACARILTEKEHDRESYRTHIFAFSGFSFAALSAFAVVDSQLAVGLSCAVYYLLISFFAYMLALNFVAYKARRWEDHRTIRSRHTCFIFSCHCCAGTNGSWFDPTNSRGSHVYLGI